MADLFNRVAQVTIGQRVFQYPPFAMEFEQTLALGCNNTTILKMYNPNDDTIRAAATTNNRNVATGPIVTIDAGFVDLHGTCCVGQVIKREVKKMSGDVVMTLTLSDYTTRYNTALVNVGFKSMLASQIITNICLSAGINPGKVDLGKDIMFDTYVANGYFRTVLDRLCALTGSINSFKNGVLYITPKSINGSIPVTVQYLTPQSGLVGIPEPTMVNGKAALKFQTLFFFSLQSGDKVELYSAEYHTNLKLVNGKKKFATFADIAESEWEAEIV